jgi:hypothetical protein
MRLFEFDQEKAQVTQIVALINQLKQDIEDGDVDPQDYTVDELLDYFQMYDIILDVNDLYNMIKVPPLKDLIKNIQGDKVLFVGQGEEDALDAPDDKQDEIVAKMAKSAMK